MKHKILKNFAADKGISIRTLKAKYNDCIYREGRQSFINVDKFEEVFPERSKCGHRNMKSISKFHTIPQLNFQLKRTEQLLNKTIIAAKSIKDEINKIEETENKERLSVVYLGKLKQVNSLKTKKDELMIRKTNILKKLTEELSEYEEEALLDV